LLARYGFRGVFDFSKPWRPVLFVLATAAVLACGFRGSLFAFGLTLAFLFYFERLHRTAVLAVCLGLLFAGSLAVFKKIKAEGEQARTLRAWAEVELRNDQVEASRGKLQEARTIFARLGAKGELARTESLLQEQAGQTYLR
jgi:hypothetical protein